ncbi:MAG: S-methyl-5'-thioadenosine phosphorylase [Candidatus Dormibacteraeota bacterium]|uniref:Purine nucleoside phosphorylase n=1 Tax=Candidatus Aeolococcus gillhamiae TaxID=3127015 RepID=A0A2W5ZFF3_9BACT|nr:S-methyl-5'-thioadenosine phosphorylase [Candidatus Dormibacteraeota bacterium]PZR84202.1 MAG: S-methyl-5'-thioadenosine phosphorylase [Candidatus Dormibacter sp. RRmetagenome_bin12]
MPYAEFAVIGGSGFYALIDGEGAERVAVETPYGEPSDTVALGFVAGRMVAFLPRHGSGHTVPPHRINYRANLWALASLGVTRVIAPCAAGSLRAEVDRGDVVVCDQVIDRTRGQRHDTFFDGPEVAHLSAPSPYCAELSAAAATACTQAGLHTHHGGTVLVIEGPRFATVAESREFARTGAHIINMTQYPEVVLAQELGMCYAGLGLVTDHDAGVDRDQPSQAVTQEEVLRVFAANLETLRAAIIRLIAALPATRGCDCAARRPQTIRH